MDVPNAQNVPRVRLPVKGRFQLKRLCILNREPSVWKNQDSDNG
jgi:hypothetical protein